VIVTVVGAPTFINSSVLDMFGGPPPAPRAKLCVPAPAILVLAVPKLAGEFDQVAPL
jgi:hypothetical protein